MERQLLSDIAAECERNGEKISEKINGLTKDLVKQNKKYENRLLKLSQDMHDSQAEHLKRVGDIMLILGDLRDLIPTAVHKYK